MPTYMFEVYFGGSRRSPAELELEAQVTARVLKWGGRLDYREDSYPDNQLTNIVLTFEFDELEKAQFAADELRKRGTGHVEGPGPYGDQ